MRKIDGTRARTQHNFDFAFRFEFALGSPITILFARASEKITGTPAVNLALSGLEIVGTKPGATLNGAE